MSDHAPDPVTLAAAPEEQVVASPPPEPDYSRYRVEPGALIRLADCLAHTSLASAADCSSSC